MKKLGQALFLSLVAWLTMFADCDRNVTQDPGFSDWCGDHLCSWKVEHGNVVKVSTWDPNDFGVEMLSLACVGPGDCSDAGNFDLVRLSQLTVEQDAQCLLFTSVGKFDPEAQVSLAADFNNDGTIDFSGTLGSADWTQVQAEFSAPHTYRGITFYVQKEGLSQATLAQLRVQATQGCQAPPVQLSNLPIGDVCALDGGPGQCTTNAVCAQLPLSDHGICSGCNSPCPTGAVCEQLHPNMPFLCVPVQGQLQYGNPCLRSSDCASGVCIGAKAQQLVLDDAGTCDLDALDLDGGENCKNFGALAGKCQ
ncbi:MAG: hypothetical protein QM723_39975 [Myxococcaceae bacterium]